MSSRLLRSYWNYRRYSSFLRGISLQGSNESYAISARSTGVSLQFSSNLITKEMIKNSTAKMYTTQVAPKQYTPNGESLLAFIISHYKVAGYVQYDQCKKLLDALENDYSENRELLTKENIQFLLHACGTQMPIQNSEERIEMFQRLWTYLKQHDLLTKDSYIEQLQVLQYNQIPLEDLQSFLKEISTVTTESVETPALFSEFLNVACSSGNMKNATEVLAAMRERNFALTEQNFNALIMGYGRSNDLKGIQTTVDNMQAAGVMLSNATQATLFVAFIENNDNAKALDILRKYHGQFSEQQILKMLRTGLRMELNDEMIILLVQELPAEYTSGIDISFGLRQLCNEFVHTNKLNAVKTIISALPKPNFSENQSIDTYASSILTELFRAQLPEAEIINFAEMLKESEKNTRALHVITEIAMHRSPPTALAFLEALSVDDPLRPHYFWPLIMYNFRRHGENGILNTLQHMKRLKVSCDNETLTLYILPHMGVMLENPVQAVKMLTEAGVKTSSLLTPVLRHLLGQQKMYEAHLVIEYFPMKLDIMEQLMPALQQLSINIRATKRYSQFAKLLNQLFKCNENPKEDFIGQLLINMLRKQVRLQNDLRSFQHFLSEIQKIGLRISPAAITSLEESLKNISDASETKNNEEIHQQISQTLSQMKDRSLNLADNVVGGVNVNSSFIKHPRDMSLSELECHLIELESKRMNARGVLRRLLQLHVRENNLERALEIKAKCDKLRVQESPGMIASVFDLYIKVGDLPKAEETLKKLQKTYPGFQIDEHKFIDYTALLVRENQLETGLQLLAERSQKQRINGGDYVIKNVWNFLTSVAQHAARQEPKLPTEQNLTREAFEFMRKHGYCRTHNAILGPIVREYLLRGDIKSAISEFSSLAEKYKHTPLQFELFSILVRFCNDTQEEKERFPITKEEAQKLLSELTTIVSKIHGPANMNSALVLAFAESGTDNQLRRLLMNPEFRINHDLLQKNCKHLGKEGSVRTLLRLAKGARGLNHAVNEQTIYDLLLDNFIKTNDCAAAVDLFERLDADDNLKISADFVKKLINLMRVNKLEVPSNITLKAYINKVKM